LLLAKTLGWVRNSYIELGWCGLIDVDSASRRNDVMRRSRKYYSITSSARASIVGGTTIPGIPAV
jgi:hypothetical protein